MSGSVWSQYSRNWLRATAARFELLGAAFRAARSHQRGTPNKLPGTESGGRFSTWRQPAPGWIVYCLVVVGPANVAGPLGGVSPGLSTQTSKWPSLGSLTEWIQGISSILAAHACSVA